MYDLSSLQDSEQRMLLERLYIDEQKSWDTIAELCNCSRGKLRRLAKKFEIQSRSKSETQKIVLKENGHPLQGKKRTAQEKEKISRSMGKHWDGLSDEEREHKSQISKQMWANRSPAENERIQQAGASAIRNASTLGSKLERYLAVHLQAAGFATLLHKEHYLKNRQLQIDLFIKSLGVAIEVDGPTHFEPVFGEKQFQRIRAADNEKTGLILGAGLYFIRIKHTQRISQRFQKDTLEKVLAILESIQSGSVDRDKRYFEV